MGLEDLHRRGIAGGGIQAEGVDGGGAEAGLLARGEEALAAAAGRVNGAGAEDAGDVGVAEFGQMPDGDGGTGGVIDGDGGAHAAHAPVQHHHRPPLAAGEAADEGIAQYAAGGGSHRRGPAAAAG